MYSMSRIEPTKRSVTPLSFDSDGSAVLFTSPQVGGSWANGVPEGKLAVDVVETEKAIVIVCPMAGASTEEIDIAIHKDVLTIRGYRHSPAANLTQRHDVHSECFWGHFSRTIVLPGEVKEEQARAEYKNGILSITVPKKITEKKIPVVIVED